MYGSLFCYQTAHLQASFNAPSRKRALTVHHHKLHWTHCCTPIHGVPLSELTSVRPRHLCDGELHSLARAVLTYTSLIARRCIQTGYARTWIALLHRMLQV
jgi:hypothetical protein